MLIRIHTYFNIMKSLLIFKVWSTHHIYTYQQVWCCWFPLSISTLHLQETQNKDDSHTNTIIPSRRLCVCFVFLCLCLFSFFVNAITAKTVNFDEWSESVSLNNVAKNYNGNTNTWDIYFTFRMSVLKSKLNISERLDLSGIHT